MAEKIQYICWSIHFFDHIFNFSTTLQMSQKVNFTEFVEFFYLSTFWHQGEIIPPNILNIFDQYWIFRQLLNFFDHILYLFRTFKCQKQLIYPNLLNRFDLLIRFNKFSKIDFFFTFERWKKFKIWTKKSNNDQKN